MCNPRCAVNFFKFAIAVPRRERLAALVRRHDAVRPRDPPTHCADGVCRSRTRALALTIPSLVPAVFLSLAPAVFIWIILKKKTTVGKVNLNVIILTTVQPPLFSLCPSVRPSLRVSLSAGTPRIHKWCVGRDSSRTSRPLCPFVFAHMLAGTPSHAASQWQPHRRPHQPHAARPSPGPPDLRGAPQGLCITPPCVFQLDASTR